MKKTYDYKPKFKLRANSDNSNRIPKSILLFMTFIFNKILSVFI